MVTVSFQVSLWNDFMLRHDQPQLGFLVKHQATNSLQRIKGKMARSHSLTCSRQPSRTPSCTRPTASKRPPSTVASFPPNVLCHTEPTHALAAASFSDIVSGSNYCMGQSATNVCCDDGYDAVPGWDPVSGLGSPRFIDLGKRLLEGATWKVGNCTIPNTAPTTPAFTFH